MKDDDSSDYEEEGQMGQQMKKEAEVEYDENFSKKY